MNKVLLVDDEAKILALGRAALSRVPEYETIVARDGQEALEICAEQSPEVVFLDVMMPRKDGYAVCREIKANPALQHIKVCIVTAFAQQSTLKEATAAGADDYMTKPFRPSELLAKAAALLAAA
ncbi:MAG: response regulator [Chloroflexi bacterium]|nr:response regulator [Chloroflexota bacterium]